jgi:hypothetical protein
VDRSLQTDLGTSETSAAPSPNCPPESCSNRKRDGSILMQRSPPDDLKLFSQARGALLSELPGYAFDSRGGQGVTVYVIDTGLNSQSRVSVTDYQ